jgi:myo-inositol-1(or 4)-monophosphatase
VNKVKQETLDLRKCLDLAVEIARDASLSIFPDSDKSIAANLERDVKLEGDIRLNQLIVRRLQEKTPYAVLSEEEGFSKGKLDNKEYLWIVDPLDGSLNFSRGIPLFCISIALWREMEPLLGVVYDFNRDEMFTGLVTEGAWLNGMPIKVSDVVEESEAVLCTGFPVSTDFSESALLNFVKDIQSYRKVRLLGSAALSLAYVASGRADAYHENDIAIWDVAAGIAIVKAAGGVVHFRPSKVGNRLIVKALNDFLLSKVVRARNERFVGHGKE